jgi:hypothetical protein
VEREDTYRIKKVKDNHMVHAAEEERIAKAIEMAMAQFGITVRLNTLASLAFLDSRLPGSPLACHSPLAATTLHLLRLLVCTVRRRPT